ncbi:MAG: polymer-forming cytoskeletal protein [Spirochaetes bacterium]|nr:polymer-forming cytoskeletal protein [Spirochaetota bacterium]
MSDVQISIIDEEQLDTVLATDVEFSGTVIFKKPFMIKGRVSGTVRAESDLFIDEKAVVEASITAESVSIRGTVKGDIVARKRVDLFACCSVDGDITAPEVAMETGCRFNGICTMTGKRDEGK